MNKVVLSGVRPTGKQHLGHWIGTLSNWIKLQQEYECFFMVADWHALMSEYRDPSHIREYSFDNVCEWLSYGIDPQRCVIFEQSKVPAHLELFLILSYITPLGWLSRCPTFKEQIKQLKDRDINTYAFLGYPVLQSSDILLYKANFVPVGEDQLPHLELCREIARRFHHIYKKKCFVEPKPLLTSVARLAGLDGRKMSKSYENYIALDEEDSVIEKKILSMITDPARKIKTDKGHPDICNVFAYYTIFKEEDKERVRRLCMSAGRGCKECKKILADSFKSFIGPRREKKKELLRKKDYIRDILKEGNKKANAVASGTLEEVKAAMKI
ncbi:MAG: tryptophan--tRNA ligase [Candidatus Omnitrophota bacterium]|nr:MAG: tryptophan--tRNA ligase [Candidatus Omnitrophota bacterium]